MRSEAPFGVETLRQLVALRGISDETLVALSERGESLAVDAGECVIRRDEPNSRMHVVVAGGLRVDLREPEGAPIARLGMGDTVGELSLLAHSPGSATVTAEIPTTLFAMDEATFYWLIGVSHGFAVTLLVKLAERLRSNNDAVEANIALRMHFEQAALHDALTGVHSRRWLDETLPRIVQRHEFSREPLSIVMMDVDHFKRINDTYGHPAGDAVLSALGRICRDRLRPTDMVARAGGEEFVLILPQTSLDGGVVAAERLRSAIANTNIACDGGISLRLTVSLGVATLQANTSVQMLISQADQALYAAKQGGRNRTEAVDDSGDLRAPDTHSRCEREP